MNATRPLDHYTIARFWTKVDVRRPGECWEWRAAVNDMGYGVFRATNETRNIKAHRMAWRIAHGEDLDAGVKLLHACDNPPCVNPAHLRPGTQRENIADMVSKGRQRGIEHSMLTAADRAAIMAAADGGETQASIARRFGISSSYVSMIAAGKRLRRKESV